MLVSDFDYALPPERIAQAPTAEREQARLYVLPRDGRPARHAAVSALPELCAELLPEGALLVVNDSRVMRARLRGRKPSGGRVELLLVAPLSTPAPAGQGGGAGDGWVERWLCLGGASKPIRPGAAIELDGERPPSARVLEVAAQEVTVEFAGLEPGGMRAAAERLGEVPLPPYIRRPDGPDGADAARYQTVYAREPGSAAAPTAGLHLTPALLDRLRARGIDTVALTLHVGLGTFAPLAVPDDADLSAIGALHPERFTIPAATAAAIAAAIAAGRRVLCVGTTTVRALESAADGRGGVRPGDGETRIFLGPGHRFQVASALLTNFHLPRSTLLLLVAAVAGHRRLLDAYADAVARGYRFYSYGDAMLIV